MSGVVSHHIDCMEYMSTLTDNAFDLAIVDPPYGINMSSHKQIGLDIPFGGGNGKIIKTTRFAPKNWDNAIPDKEYFNELCRVSKNQIIWGGNYFIEHLNNTSCVLVWDKVNGKNNFADCELAWTSFKTAVRIFRFQWQGMLQGDMKNKEKRIHPTQKPVALYKWMLRKYAKPGDRILDTHLGSGSSAIAAHHYGFDFVGCELDKDYFEAATKRFNKETRQLKLF